MQTTGKDVFASKNAGLEAFLYADVGTEENGSTLTVLSALARLGKDPWAEAARWASLPKTSAIDSLAESIAEIPNLPSCLVGGRDHAARLVQLLPANAATTGHSGASITATAMPRVVSVAMLYLAFAVFMALNTFLISKSSSHPQVPVDHSTAAAASAAAGLSARLDRP